MSYDNSVRLLGSSGNPEQTLTTTGTGSAVFVGKNKMFVAELRIGGRVSGTGPTLDMLIQESTDGSSGWSTAATFPQVGASDVGYFTGGTTPAYEVPGTFPRMQSFVTSKAYVRASYTIGGTGSPTFTDTSVELMPQAVATLRSGVA